uniref:Uncharacterized protein LOC113787546 n=1 Tax=Cicer arietinum TaxID=3827 RepID=A0A3Q7XF48_CICAR|nr:uncharacterized protein LOC113787546 [Cicer arietinum]
MVNHQPPLRAWSNLTSLRYVNVPTIDDANGITSSPSSSSSSHNIVAPTQIESVNETIEKPNVNDNDSFQKSHNNEKSFNFEEYSNPKVITIGGENKGSYMKIIQTIKKPNKLHKPIVGMYMNSNVQCVNNSLLLHASCTHHDPGVHLISPNNSFGKGFNIKEQQN